MRTVISAIVISMACAAVTAAGPSVAESQTSAPVQLRGLSQADADKVLGTVKAAQRRLADGEAAYFQLMSGAPAAYEQTRIAPRDAFLALSFDTPFSIEDRNTGNPLWRPYRIEIVGQASLVWQVEVVLGVNDNLERVEIVARPPHPF